MRTATRIKKVTEPIREESIEWTYLDAIEVAHRAGNTLSATPRPFIRWAGSKQRLLTQLTEHLPARYHRYYEPFMGAGSMYFLLRPRHAVLNDYCGPLMEMYSTVRVESSQIEELLKDMDLLDRDYYYKVRSEAPRTAVERAARFIYLNRAAWNGLYRVNARGEFNVPYGMPRSPHILDVDNFRSAATHLAEPGTKLTSLDFEQALEGAGSGDLVFLDPPYASSKRREGFVDYNEKLFTWDDQRRLAARAEKLRKSGAKVIVTNAFNTAIRELYPGFSHHALVRRSSLASDMARRGSVAESVFVS